MDFYVKDNLIIRTAADDVEKKKGKKGDGINSAISLLQELRVFQEKVEATIEAQDITENKQKIAKYAQSLEELYSALIEIASSGVKNMRQNNVAQTGLDEKPESETATMQPDTTIQAQAPKLPVTPTAP
jgi:2C-methyl-D-erythritol 2,4-cyclodiphosphate synthase